MTQKFQKAGVDIIFMNKNLLIVGAGAYGMVANEIASEMRCFDIIDFVDDAKKIAANGKSIVGTTKQLKELSEKYGNVVVAIGNAEKRLSLLKFIEEETTFNIVSLISSLAYISPSAQIGKGCVIEPMAVVQTGCEISDGCIISAGAVVNHFTKCCRCVHIDCNATVKGSAVVPSGTKVCSGDVFE